MAKIALISKTASPEALGLAQALYLQKHEVLFITGCNEEIKSQLPFSVLTFFKTWSVLEALRFLPRLIAHSPQILHIVVAEKNSSETSMAILSLASVMKSIPNRLVAFTSYGSPSLKYQMWLKPLLKICDIVTFGTRESLMFHKRKGDLKRNGVTEVLPPLMEFAPVTYESEKNADLIKLTARLNPYFIIPAGILGAEDSWTDFNLDFNFVVLGSRPKTSWGNKFFFVGENLKKSEIEYLLQMSSGLYIANLDFSVLELMQFHTWSLQHKLPVYATQRQAEALPGLCIHEKNGWVLSHLKQFEQLLSSKPRPRPEESVSSYHPSNIADSTLNELSRLYAKAFEQKLSNPI